MMRITFIMIITMIVTVMSESKQLLSCVQMHSCARHCNNNNQDNENNEAGDDIDHHCDDDDDKEDKMKNPTPNQPLNPICCC